MEHNEQQTVTLIKSDKDTLIELASVLLGWAVAYYFLNPDCMDDARSWFRSRVDSVAHKISVWQATQDIRTLPEIDD